VKRIFLPLLIAALAGATGASAVFIASGSSSGHTTASSAVVPPARDSNGEPGVR
jgi:hypothetical protein